MWAYLFPFSTCSNKSNYGFGNSSAACDNCGMVDEFICPVFQQKECADEDRNVVDDNIEVGHCARIAAGSSERT